MKNKYLGYALGTALGIGIAFAPEQGEAFYVSQKEAQKAGIKTSQITKTKVPMGDKVSYKGSLENDETFNDIAGRVHEWAEDFFGTDLSDQITRKALASFNSYRKVEMPLVSVPCKYQLMVNYVRELEKEMIEQRGKPGPMEKDLEFLKGKLGELEKLYEQDIEELREKYTEHEKRIKELEKRPGQKDYSAEIDELWKENEELREMLESMEGGYAQPPPVEGYGSYGGIIFGQPGWFPDLPYPYLLLSGSIYCGVPFGDSFYWRRWGWLDYYGGGFRARRRDGRIFDYHGPRSLFRDYYSGHHGLPDGKHWEKGGKDFDSHDRHRRESPREFERHKIEHPGDRDRHPRELPRERDRRFEGMHGNGKGFDPRSRGKNPSREDYSSHQFPKGNLQGAPRPNQQLNQGRMEYRGPQGFPQGGGRQQNFQGRGLNVQPRNLLPQNRNPRHRGR
ncbi:MAG: hypothetical protein MUP55_01090 [Candidatus Aenigmarchaeota archaeon]|nr:hypothetical protein [Candidatus Aenigmarchaeota archaeon]